MSETKESRRFASRLFGLGFGDVLRLIIACTAVGLLLSFFNVDPRTLWSDFFGTIARAWDETLAGLADGLGWAVQYLVLGAVVVIPIWIVFRVLYAVFGRK